MRSGTRGYAGIAVLLASVAFPIFAAQVDPAETIAKGVALHDQGRYGEAIAIFREVLLQDPQNELALYELSHTLWTTKAFDECIETAERGLKSAKQHRAELYAVQGNCLDEAGSPQKAVKIYRRGLSEFPTDPGLAFNCAWTQLRLQNFKEARRLAKISIGARPNHISSHYILVVAYATEGYTVQGLLAALRFLSLEPLSERAVGVASLARNVLSSSVAKQPDGSVAVTVNTQGPTDEGDFTVEATMLPLVAAVWLAEDSEAKTDSEKLAVQLSSFLASLSEESPDAKASFARTTYVPFFQALHQEDVLVPFTYLVFSSLEVEGARQWNETHSAEIEKLNSVLRRLNGAGSP